jgi:phosphatidylinositol glycan class A protein
VLKALARAIEYVQAGHHNPHIAHGHVRDMYNWTRVATRTEDVYEHIMALPERTLLERVERYECTC